MEENIRVRKLALCQKVKTIIRPGIPYVFEAIPGCKDCCDLLDEINSNLFENEKPYDFGNPTVADEPIYTTTNAIPIIKNKKKSKKNG